MFTVRKVLVRHVCRFEFRWPCVVKLVKTESLILFLVFGRDQIDGRAPGNKAIWWAVSADVESLAWDPHTEHSFVVIARVSLSGVPFCRVSAVDLSLWSLLKAALISNLKLS